MVSSPVPPRAGQLSPGQAILALVVAAVGVAFAGLSLSLINLRLAGRSASDLTRLDDPKFSPLVSDPTWISLATLMNELTVAAVLALWLWWARASLVEALPTRVPALSSVLGAVLLAFGLGPFAEAAGVLVQWVLKRDVTIAHVVLSAAGGKSALEFAAVLVCLAVLPALIEEAMFRGAVTAAFVRRSRLAQVIWPSVLFGLFHIEPTQVAGTIVLGLGFGLARVVSESLWPSVIAHCLFNALVVIAARFNNQAPDWQIHGTELAIGGLLICVGLLLLAWSRLRLSRQATARPPFRSPF